MAHIEKNYPDREIQVEIPEDFRMVPMDAKLMEQVITNLLDNAIKHTTCEDTQVLRSVMASTRRKIENNPAKPEYILTEIGIGYRMRERDK